MTARAAGAGEAFSPRVLALRPTFVGGPGSRYDDTGELRGVE